MGSTCQLGPLPHRYNHYLLLGEWRDLTLTRFYIVTWIGTKSPLWTIDLIASISYCDTIVSIDLAHGSTLRGKSRSEPYSSGV